MSTPLRGRSLSATLEGFVNGRRLAFDLTDDSIEFI
jgi:hypothetical protein